MKEIFKTLFKDKYFKIVIILLFAGAFLRFFKLPEYAMFLADQGRDAIVIKRIITFEHFPAIGAPTSLGSVYLGPFYYYFIAPWLLLFNFNPVGLAFGVAFFSSVFIVINYLIVEELVGRKYAIYSSILLVFSSTLIDFSRFSWNPNLLPLFSLLTVFFAIRALKRQEMREYILAGAMLSISAQLHYLALFLLPALFFLGVKYFDKKKIFLFAKGTVSFIVSFVIISLPLVIYDFRHNFLNINNFIKLISSPSTISGNYADNFLSALFSLQTYIFYNSFTDLLSNFLLVVFVVTFVIILLKKHPIADFYIVFFVLLSGTALLPGPKHPHYFGALYPFYFVIISHILLTLSHERALKFFLYIFIAVYILINAQQYSFLWEQGNSQITHAKKVGKELNNIIKEKRFNIAVQPDGWQEDSYLYFLELEGKRPVDRRKNEVGDAMYVICGEPCDLKASKSWSITMFGKGIIENSWQTEGVTIYKLVR